MDHTAAGICYSYGIPQVLLKVAIKFKNANLFLNVIVEHFPQTIPVQPYFRETGCVTRFSRDQNCLLEWKLQYSTDTSILYSPQRLRLYLLWKQEKFPYE